MHFYRYNGRRVMFTDRNYKGMFHSSYVVPQYYIILLEDKFEILKMREVCNGRCIL